ncbi:hypothetical protein H5410_057317, partial [Solanum commersonii]
MALDLARYSENLEGTKSHQPSSGQDRKLDNELQEEKKNHQDTLASCKDLEEMETAADLDAKTNQ